MGWIVQAQPTDEGARLFPRPPTAVGGLFNHSLQTKALDCFPEYHPRQRVDRSGPAYKRRLLEGSLNPTHVSVWIVQAQPTHGHTRILVLLFFSPSPCERRAL